MRKWAPRDQKQRNLCQIGEKQCLRRRTWDMPKTVSLRSSVGEEKKENSHYLLIMRSARHVPAESNWPLPFSSTVRPFHHQAAFASNALKKVEKRMIKFFFSQVKRRRKSLSQTRHAENTMFPTLHIDATSRYSTLLSWRRGVFPTKSSVSSFK